MKEVAILLLVAVALSGCGGTPTINTQTAQTAAGGIWSAQVLGGSGAASGFSFNTEFTVNGDTSLAVTYFQFLTQGTCFPVDGGTQNGNMDLNIDGSTGVVTGTLKYMVQASGNTLTLNGQVTGTATTQNPNALSDGSVTGTWAVTGGSGCNATGGTFTMCQSSTASSSTGVCTTTTTTPATGSQNQSLR
jgi:hypothetical protein